MLYRVRLAMLMAHEIPSFQTSDALYAFLRENNVRATHFMIGVNILWYPQEFKMAFEDNQGRRICCAVSHRTHH